MLFSQGSDLTRLQCGFVDTPEIEKMVAFVGNQIGYTTPYISVSYTHLTLPTKRIV